MTKENTYHMEEKNRLVVNDRTFNLVRGLDAPEPIQETDRE